MALHLLKVCVGIESIDHLARVQAERLARLRRDGQEPVLRHFTRHAPLRAAEIVDGGSLYWIIRRFVRVRQRILRIERVRSAEGKRCALVLDPTLVETQLQPRRPHQGWRYLEAADAPPDLPSTAVGADGLPAELAAELRELGLL